MSPGQDLMVQSSMPLSRCDEPDTAMPMLIIVPTHEIPHPNSCGVQTGKTILRPFRAVFQCSKQRLRVRIVVADPRSAPRGRDAQLVHFAQQRHRFHRRSVVRVQHQRFKGRAFLRLYVAEPWSEWSPPSELQGLSAGLVYSPERWQVPSWQAGPSPIQSTRPPPLLFCFTPSDEYFLSHAIPIYGHFRI